MVTITPAAMMGVANQQNEEEKAKLLGDDLAFSHERKPSMQWDSQRAQFVMVPSKCCVWLCVSSQTCGDLAQYVFVHLVRC